MVVSALILLAAAPQPPVARVVKPMAPPPRVVQPAQAPPAMPVRDAPAVEIPRVELVASEAPPPDVPNRPVTPRGAPENWVRSYDYPQAAREEKRTGETRVDIAVNRWGRVANCTVTSSSGHADLDEKVCEKVSRSARFYPALDADMKPTDAVWPYTVTWKEREEAPPTMAVRLPARLDNQSLPSPPRVNYREWLIASRANYPADARAEGASGRVGIRVEVAPDKTVTSCEVTASSGHASLDDATCERARELTVLEPARDVDGKATRGVMERSIYWNLPKDRAEVAIPKPYTPRPRPFPFKESGKVALSLSIDSEGKVSNCKVNSEGNLLRSGARGIDNLCDERGLSRDIKPFTDADGKPVAKDVAITFEVKLDDPK